MIKIIAIGKKHEAWVQVGLERYQKRLQSPWNTEWELLPHSSFEGSKARQQESRAIMARLTPQDFVLLLDERGKQLDSPAVSHLIDREFSTARRPVIIIGGAYGVSDELQARADLVWSLSPLVFPHQLVRLILIEQLYRAQEIARGSNYHHI